MKFVHVSGKFATFYISYNVIKIRNDSSKPPHHYKQNLIFYFHIVIWEKKHTKIGQFNRKYETLNLQVRHLAIKVILDIT
jgi:hypothetical protein